MTKDPNASHRARVGGTTMRKGRSSAKHVAAPPGRARTIAFPASYRNTFIAIRRCGCDHGPRFVADDV
ncbi:MAG: hypothetical protein U1F10_09775 [Burkholderiales bacterium]